MCLSSASAQRQHSLHCDRYGTDDHTKKNDTLFVIGVLIIHIIVFYVKSILLVKSIIIRLFPTAIIDGSLSTVPLGCVVSAKVCSQETMLCPVAASKISITSCELVTMFPADPNLLLGRNNCFDAE